MSERLSDEELADVAARCADGTCARCDGSARWGVDECPQCDGTGNFALSTATMASLIAELRAARVVVEAAKVTGETSDGYHTFNELYEHRIALFLALCTLVSANEDTGYVWYSRLHSDGSSIPGWFVMGIGTEDGEQITYHLPDNRWADAEDIDAEERERAPEFDGHTSADVLVRLRRFLP